MGWGKVYRPTKNQQKVHRLIFHLLDVGATFFALLAREPRFLERFTFLSSFDPDLTRRLLAFFAAAHDVGKCSPGFQYLCNAKLEKALKPIWAELENHPKLGSGFSYWQRNQTPTRMPCHGYLSVHALFRFFNPEHFEGPDVDEPSDPMATQILWQLSLASGYHHDKDFQPGFDEDLDIAFFKSEYRGDQAWTEQRQKLLNCLWETIVGDAGLVSEVRAALADAPTCSGTTWDPSFLVEQLLFAGQTTVADWIASGKDHFPPSGLVPVERDLAAYFQGSLKRAATVLDELVWTGHHVRRVQGRSWQQLFPNFIKPNPLQAEILALRDQMHEPMMVLIEGPMGIGKTEAALTVLSAVSNKDRGFFVALPTQATGNQMYGRVKKFLDRMLEESDSPGQLQLAHGNRRWNKTFVETFHGTRTGRARLFETDSFDEATPSKVVATEWAAMARTGLLAEFGVGTIDTLLAAALVARKHYFVRFVGLYGKTIIIDEVHANDTYMDGLFRLLLTWLGALGCHVVLLSATLPEHKRHAYLAAYSGGSPGALPACSYPRITSVVGNRPESAQGRHIALDQKRVKQIAVKLKSIRSPADVVDHVKADVAACNGQGVFVLICNTVFCAQDVFALFQESPDFDNNCLLLHHARFIMGQRVAHEARVNRELGKDALKEVWEKRADRPLMILIGTSVLEQSLDYDCDRMYSLPCPVDLFFQRTGRLYRRFYWFPNRAFPEPATATLFHFGPLKNPDLITCGSAFIYDAYLLLRTLRLLAERIERTGNALFNDRDDLDEMVQMVYQKDGRPVGKREAAALEAWEHARAHEETQAHVSLLPAPDDCAWRTSCFGENGERVHSWFTQVMARRNQPHGSQPKKNTRLGEFATQAVLLVRRDKQLVPLGQNGMPLKKGIAEGKGRLEELETARLLIQSSVYLHEGWVDKFGEHLIDFNPYDHPALREAKKLIGCWDERRERVWFPQISGAFYEPQAGFRYQKERKEEDLCD
nr:CRISPR-associated helicase Cas3' [Acanthopleuribacter pedis]